MFSDDTIILVMVMAMVGYISQKGQDDVFYREITRLWPELEELKGFGFPHLVGSAKIEGGRIVEFEAEVVLMRGLRESIFEDSGFVEFVIPIEKSAGPEVLVKKLSDLLGV